MVGFNFFEDPLEEVEFHHNYIYPITISSLWLGLTAWMADKASGVSL